MKIENSPGRIAIFRALQLGDLLCAIPALRALRKAFPNAAIFLIGLPWSRTFVERFGAYLDTFIEFPGYPGLLEATPQVEQIPAFLQEMQSLAFDLVLQMHGNGSVVNPLVTLLGGKQTAGFFLPGQFRPDERLFMEYPDRGSEVQRMLNLVTHLGLPLQGEGLEFPLTPQDWEELRGLEAKWSFQASSSAVVHVGSRDHRRRWPAERFAAVARGLAQRGLQVVLTGTEQEAGLTREVAEQMQAPAIDLAGRTSLGSLAALLAGTRLLVCNDTGVSHLAAALQVPSIVLFSASDPARWAPADRRRHQVVTQADQAQPDEILERVDRALREERVDAG
jgi:ADP-heptose:LPS heptosyltransferase